MKTLILALLLSGACASFGADCLSEDKNFEKAFQNIQQAGDFYFIPFPKNIGLQSGAVSSYPENRVCIAQAILTALDKFQKERKLPILSFEVQRDHSVQNYPTIHGIFIHAVPPAPKK